MGSPTSIRKPCIILSANKCKDLVRYFFYRFECSDLALSRRDIVDGDATISLRGKSVVEEISEELLVTSIVFSVWTDPKA